MKPLSRQIWTCLLAGAIAIALNTAVLAAADYIPLVTARGGLLKLITIYVGPTLSRAGAGSKWVALGLPTPGGTSFQLWFHVVVGMAMALFYGLALEPILPGKPWWKGMIYAIGIWLANALIILPWLGEGIAGSRNLGPLGMAYFAAAHTLFFVLLAVFYARFNRPVRERIF